MFNRLVFSVEKWCAVWKENQTSEYYRDKLLFVKCYCTTTSSALKLKWHNIKLIIQAFNIAGKQCDIKNIPFQAPYNFRTIKYCKL
jgi:hypothetical protein